MAATTPTATMRTEPHQRRSSGSIEEILNAAEAVFAENGVASATTAMIAAEAGFSVGRVYYWFETKEQVARAVAQRSEATIIALFASMLVDDKALSTPELLASIVGSTVDAATRHPSILVMLSAGPDGTQDVGIEHLRAVVGDGVTSLVLSRVPGISTTEASVVSTTLVATVVSSIATAMHERNAGSARGDALITELVYLLSAYLACRFPASDNPSKVVAAVRPARADVPLPPVPLLPYLAPEDSP